MRHPSASDLLAYERGMGSPDLLEAIDAHIEICESCRRELSELKRLSSRLAEWGDAVVPPEYVEAQLSLLDLQLQEDQRVDQPVEATPRFFSRGRIRGALIAAASIISTIAIQGLFINPLLMQREIRAVFEMAPLPISYPVAGAIPDTMIVLNVHADGSYSASIFEGVYSFEGLKEQLAREVHRGEYWTLAVDATRMKSPFTLWFADLVFFKKKLGINEFRLWTDDVVSQLSRGNLTLEKLEQIVGAGQPRIEVTPKGIDIETTHKVSLTIATNGLISLYGQQITLAEMLYILGNFHTLNPDGKLHIQYWHSSVSDSVLAVVRDLAAEVGIREISDSKWGMP